MYGKAATAVVAVGAVAALGTQAPNAALEYQPGNSTSAIVDAVGDHDFVRTDASVRRHWGADLVAVAYEVLRDRPTPVLKIEYVARNVYIPESGSQQFVTLIRDPSEPDRDIRIRSNTIGETVVVGGGECGWASTSLDEDKHTQVVPLKCLEINGEAFASARIRRTANAEGNARSESRDTTAWTAKSLDLTYNFKEKAAATPRPGGRHRAGPGDVTKPTADPGGKHRANVSPLHIPTGQAQWPYVKEVHPVVNS